MHEQELVVQFMTGEGDFSPLHVILDHMRGCPASWSVGTLDKVTGPWSQPLMSIQCLG